MRVDVRNPGPIEFFRSGVKRLVPVIERQFARGNRRLERLALLVGFLRISFAADFLCLVIIQEIQPGFRQWNAFNRDFKIMSAQPVEGRRSHFRIAIVELGIHRVPEALDHPADQLEPGSEAGKSFFMEKRFSQPDRELQVLALCGDRLAGQLDDECPIGDFALALPVAHRTFVILPAGFTDFVVNRSIAEVFSAGIAFRDGVEDIVPERHVSYAAADSCAVNSILRTSSSGNSSPSTRNIFCPTGMGSPPSTSCQCVSRPRRTLSLSSANDLGY